MNGEDLLRGLNHVGESYLEELLLLTEESKRPSESGKKSENGKRRSVMMMFMKTGAAAAAIALIISGGVRWHALNTETDVEPVTLSADSGAADVWERSGISGELQTAVTYIFGASAGAEYSFTVRDGEIPVGCDALMESLCTMIGGEAETLGFEQYARPATCDHLGQTLRADWVNAEKEERVIAVIEQKRTADAVKNRVTLRKEENMAFPAGDNPFSDSPFSFGASLGSLEEMLEPYGATVAVTDRGTPLEGTVYTVPVENEDIAWLRLEFSSMDFLHDYALAYELNFRLPADDCLTGVRWIMADAVTADGEAWKAVREQLEEEWGPLAEGYYTDAGGTKRRRWQAFRAFEETDALQTLDEKLKDAMWYPPVKKTAEGLSISVTKEDGIELAVDGRNRAVIGILAGE